MSKEKKKGSKSFYWFLGISALSVLLLIMCQVIFKDIPIDNDRFYENTKINGIDVSNMTSDQAKNIIVSDLLSSKNKVEVKLNYNDKTWTLSGSDFEVSDKVEASIEQALNYGRSDNAFKNKKIAKKIKKNGLNYNISYNNILGGFDTKLEEIIGEVEKEAKSSSIEFHPDEKQVFKINSGEKGVVVVRDKLYSEIENQFNNSTRISIDIPTTEVLPEDNENNLKEDIVLRSSFSTNYSKSSADRKHNIKLALKNFNGLVVNPGEIVSFNEKTGLRTADKGYKNAHIIMNGKYVDGTGGGVCQASTTLYNALVLADLNVITANHHTLPSSYVPLSFDAMVSGDYSDLVFENNLTKPIYIRTLCDNDNVTVEVYGQKFEDGITVKLRSEIVKVLGHNGDRIVVDEKGEYDNKILYKGEFYRLSYPKEGYESKGYVQYIKDGKVIDEKEIRHDYYQPQEGIVMEGSNELGEGMSLPNNTVSLVKPQKVTEVTLENAKQKFKKTQSSAYYI